MSAAVLSSLGSNAAAGGLGGMMSSIGSMFGGGGSGAGLGRLGYALGLGGSPNKGIKRLGQGYMDMEKEARIATVTKTRLAAFPDGDAFCWSASNDKNDRTAVNEFVKRLGDGIMTPSKSVALADSTQVGEIERLLEIIKVSEADKEKVLSKAGAESWYELTGEQANATIEWLKGKLK